MFISHIQFKQVNREYTAAFWGCFSRRPCFRLWTWIKHVCKCRTNKRNMGILFVQQTKEKERNQLLAGEWLVIGSDDHAIRKEEGKGNDGRGCPCHDVRSSQWTKEEEKFYELTGQHREERSQPCICVICLMERKDAVPPASFSRFLPPFRPFPPTPG